MSSAALIIFNGGFETLVLEIRIAKLQGNCLEAEQLPAF